VVRRQKEILKKLVERKQAEIRKVHPGLTCFRWEAIKSGSLPDRKKLIRLSLLGIPLKINSIKKNCLKNENVIVDDIGQKKLTLRFAAIMK
jgi:hypothetical protein